MKKRNLLYILVTLLTITHLAAVTPAYAGAPVHSVEPLVIDTFFPADANPCGFDLTFHVYGQLREIIWEDEAGNLTRAMELWGQMRAIWDGGGKTLDALVQGQVRASYLSDTERLVYLIGLAGLTPVPGYGIAAGTVGNQTLRQVLVGETWETVEVKWAGHDPWSEDARIAACGYLAP